VSCAVEWLISGTNKAWQEENYRDGGYVYDTLARKAIGSKYSIKVTYCFRGGSQAVIPRAVEVCRYIYRAKRLKYEGDVIVRDLYSTVFAPFDGTRMNLVMLHHIDARTFRNRTVGAYCVKTFFEKAFLADAVVVVSRYWRDVLRQQGCRRVEVIYNPFDISQFEFSDDELKSFKEQLGLCDGRPILYLGNARVEKGCLDAYEALQDMDVVFVVSGKGRIHHPMIRQYELSYRDYLKLLRISDVAVTMSKFEEGWCRTASEAMLCGTPVVGSARGGMKELLERGGQVACETLRDLPRCVATLLDDADTRIEIGRRGKAFASQFDMGYFKSAWLGVIDSVRARNRA
jgi:glycosyltransferase involved in cell wall biosynthesis